MCSKSDILDSFEIHLFLLIQTLNIVELVDS